jgi:site-specific recombinase XerD
MSSHKSTATRCAVRARVADPESLVRFAELLKLRSLASSTQFGYMKVLRRLAGRVGGDPAGLDEAEVRAHVLHLKEQRAYAPSSIRTAVAALRVYYGLHLGRDWKLFDLVRSPDRQRLPQVLTRAEVARLFAVIREERFRVVLRLIYACGLRVGEAVNLEVGDLRGGERVHIRQAKGNKDRYVPLPGWMLADLRPWWKTHRHPRWIFPGVGRGWRAAPEAAAQLAAAVEPMSIPSIQHCMRLAVAGAGLPKGTCVHTLRHSYATHLLEESVSIRLISAYLGHASLETTVIYTHLTAVNEATARAALDRLQPAVTP